MIAILKDKNLSAAEAYGISAQAYAGEGRGAVTAWENGTALCTCFFGSGAQGFEIIALHARDAEAMRALADGTVRAALNGADMNGHTDACCFEQSLFPLLESMSFEPVLQGTRAGMHLNLKDFFSPGGAGCGCAHCSGCGKRPPENG